MLNYIGKYVTLKLDESKCVGCSLCVTVCPHRVFKLRDRKAYIDLISKCIECGACMSNCPTGAIEVDAGVGCAIAILGDGGC